MRRIALLLLIAAGLAPGTWIRSAPPDRAVLQGLTVTKLDAAANPQGAMRLQGVWSLASRNEHFGGYSALLLTEGGRMFAASDRGRVLDFARPDGARSGPPQMRRFRPEQPSAKHLADIEAITRDPESGLIWAAYEGSNAIMRVDPATGEQIRVFPESMQDWSSNSGPEAMVRMADGRFIVLSESLGGVVGRASPAVMFSGDPVEPAEVFGFSFQAPDGYRATDMAALPDGRMLILVRRVVFGFPPGFASKIVLADPATITRGAIWRGMVIAELDAIAPSENYEAIAAEPASAQAGSPVTIWVMSDDNLATLQRTLLLKLKYTPPAAPKHEKAREKPARSSG
ncbi:esterase-like activity of phytase family protein [Altererythrobacter aquiaggeris]|uniref:esterase-like activity of phytase family protein n=1 Tax=Aestuarierythrobacter aquiaggeris TaxID=1898396 RepID=UPI00301A2444